MLTSKMLKSEKKKHPWKATDTVLKCKNGLFLTIFYSFYGEKFDKIYFSFGAWSHPGPVVQTLDSQLFTG